MSQAHGVQDDCTDAGGRATQGAVAERPVTTLETRMTEGITDLFNYSDPLISFLKI